jgi:hypothetical protein
MGASGAVQGPIILQVFHFNFIPAAGQLFTQPGLGIILKTTHHVIAEITGEPFEYFTDL